VGYNAASLSSFVLAVVASQIYEIPRNSPKIRTYSSSRSSKVIDLDLICDFLSVINSKFGRICCRFRDIDVFSSKIAYFSLPSLTLPLGEPVRISGWNLPRKN